MTRIGRVSLYVSVVTSLLLRHTPVAQHNGAPCIKTSALSLPSTPQCELPKRPGQPADQVEGAEW